MSDYDEFIDQNSIDRAKILRKQGKYLESISLLEKVIFKLQKYPGDRMAPIYLYSALSKEIEEMEKVISLLDLNSLLSYVKQSNRICPVPYKWNELYTILMDNSTNEYEPPRPLILAAWNFDDHSKQECLVKQIKYAESNGLLNYVAEFLIGLSEDEWYHGE